MTTEHEIVNNNDAVIEELVSLSKTNCGLCGREGYPIYLLRKTIITKNVGQIAWSDNVPKLAGREPIKALDEHEYTLRNIREGYVYLLAERSDGVKLFIGFEVTPEGVFNHKPVEDLAVDKIEPMSKSCTKINHHIPSSFITINTTVYKRVWIAYSRRAWTRKVREQYRVGKGDLSRFTLVELDDSSTKKISDGQLRAKYLFDKAIAYNTALKNSVRPNYNEKIQNLPLQPELIVDSLADNLSFYSHHDFYSRKQSAMLYSQYTDELEKKLGCQIPVVILEDNFGIVEELNYQRQVQCNFTGDPSLSGKIDEHTSSPYITQHIYSQEYKYRKGIVGTIDAYEMSLKKYYDEQSSGYTRKTHITSMSSNITEERSDISICTDDDNFNTILSGYGSCEYIPQEQSASLNFNKTWLPLKKQLNLDEIQKFKDNASDWEKTVKELLLKYSKDYANYTRWLFGKRGKSDQDISSLSETKINESNNNHFWDIEFDYQLKVFHKEYLDDAHLMLSSHIPPTDDVKALQDELVSDKDSYYYKVMAGDDPDFFENEPNDESQSLPDDSAEKSLTSVNPYSPISNEDPNEQLSETIRNITKEVLDSDVKSSQDEIISGYIVRNLIISLSADVTSGIATETKQGRVLINDDLLADRLKLLSEKIANGNVLQKNISVRMTDIVEVFEHIGNISATGGVGFQTKLKTAQGDNFLFNKADSKFYIMDVDGKSRQFTSQEYLKLKETVVKLEFVIVTESARVSPALLKELNSLLNQPILNIKALRKFVNKVPKGVEISVMLDGKSVTDSMLKQVKSETIIDPTTGRNKIVVNGLAKSFLNVVMLYYSAKNFQNNIKAFSQEQDSVKKAFLYYDLTSGMLSIAGMSTQVVGHILKIATVKQGIRMANFLTRYPYGLSKLMAPKYTTLKGMGAVFQGANGLLNITGKLLAIVGVVDGVMEIVRGVNLYFNKDDKAAGITRIIGGIVILTGALISLDIIVLTGALASTGVGIIIAVAGVVIIYISTLFERTELERWFAHCGFGIDSCKYTLDSIGLKKALDDFALLVSGLSPQLRLMSPDINTKTVLSGTKGQFTYYALYLNMTFRQFDLKNDQLTIIVTIFDKRNSATNAKLRFWHNPDDQVATVTVLENTLTSFGDNPIIVVNNDKGRYHQYQTKDTEIDNSNSRLKAVTEVSKTLVINFKLAEVLTDKVPSLKFAVDIKYKKPDLIKSDNIEPSQPLEQHYEFDGQTLMGNDLTIYG